MSFLMIGLLGRPATTRIVTLLLCVGTAAMFATGCAGNRPEPAKQVVTPPPVQNHRVTVAAADPTDPVEKEYKKLMEEDDAAADEVDQWIKNNQELQSHGGGVPKEQIGIRIATRLAPVRKAYEDFLKRHPEHTDAHLAFGGFLHDTEDDEGARREFEKALELDPKNPAVWNNLANLYSHIGPPSKMFEFYTKAIELNPKETVYYRNLADAVFVYRTNAMEFYHYTNVQQVFNKSLDLFKEAVKQDPTNFTLATELAQNYYGIIPTRTEEALGAWTNALKIASTDVEREGVYLHLARFKLNAGRLNEARAHLDAVTNTMYTDLKVRLLRNIEIREKEDATTNAPAAEKK